MPPAPNSLNAGVGRIDLHSHLLPGVDDGCQSVIQSLTCIHRLMERGYVGTVCTPHLNTPEFPLNTTNHVHGWVAGLRRQLEQHELHYEIWPGGELRLAHGCIDWMKRHGVPTLGASRAVLMDFWEPRWPKYVEQTFRWLLEQKYQPILAHPERLPASMEVYDHLCALQTMGGQLQGNTRCATGLEGPGAEAMFFRLLGEGRYHYLALDMHGPDSLTSRFEGLDVLERRLGREALDALIAAAPHRLVK